MTDVDLSIGAPGQPEVSDEPVEHFDDVDELETEPLPQLQVDEAQVRRFLTAMGDDLAGWTAPDEAPDTWKFTQAELDALSPAIASIANRRPRLQEALSHSDELIVAVTGGLYLYRNAGTVLEVRKARAAADQPEEELDAEAAPHNAV